MRAHRRLISGISVLALISAALLTGADRADAGLWGGSCLMSLTVRFAPRQGLVEVGSYTIEGAGDCVVPLGPIGGASATPSTSVHASGNGLISCAAIEGSGTWNQTWDTAPPPSQTQLAHTIVGSWPSWTITVTSPQMPASGVFVPNNLGELPTCIGVGVTSVVLTGNMVFQDP